MTKIFIFTMGSFVFSLTAYAKNNSNTQISVFLGSSLANSSSEDTVAMNGSIAFPVTVQSTYENSPSGGVEIRNIDSDSGLFKLGARVMPYRKITAASLVIAGQASQPLTIISPYSYKLTSLYGTTGYCWESFYLMIGLSYNYFDLSWPGASTTYRTKNGSGGIFGLGYKLTDNFSIEYTGYSASVSIESGDNYQFTDKLMFSDAVLALNYGF